MNIVIRTCFCLAALSTSMQVIAGDINFYDVTAMLSNKERVELAPRTLANCLISKAAYQDDRTLIVEYATTKNCNELTEDSKIVLRTTEGDFPLSGLGNIKEVKNSIWRPKWVLLDKNSIFFQFNTQGKLTKEAIESSAIFGDYCVSFYCLNDRSALNRVEETKKNRAEENGRKVLAAGGAIEHPLVLMKPLSVDGTTVIATDGGSLKAMDWFLDGLQQAQDKDKLFHEKFLKYISNNKTLLYKAKDLNQFDLEDFNRDLPKFRAQFANNMLGYPHEKPATEMVLFREIKLGAYDNATGKLAITTTCSGNCAGAGPGDGYASLSDDVVKKLAQI